MYQLLAERIAAPIPTHCPRPCTPSEESRPRARHDIVEAFPTLGMTADSAPDPWNAPCRPHYPGTDAATLPYNRPGAVASDLRCLVRPAEQVRVARRSSPGCRTDLDSGRAFGTSFPGHARAAPPPSRAGRRLMKDTWAAPGGGSTGPPHLVGVCPLRSNDDLLSARAWTSPAACGQRSGQEHPWPKRVFILPCRLRTSRPPCPFVPMRLCPPRWTSFRHPPDKFWTSTPMNWAFIGKVIDSKAGRGHARRVSFTGRSSCHEWSEFHG